MSVLRGRALLFDVGGVICADALAPKRTDLAAKYKVSIGELTRVGTGMRKHVDEGRLSETAYWTSVLSALGITADPDDVAIGPYVQIFEGMPELLLLAKESGYRLGCLTNDSLALAAARQQALAEALGIQTVGNPPRAALFSHITVSAEVGRQKPDPVIYHHAVSGLGVAPADCIFIDDTERNLLAAEKCGMQTLHFVSVAGLQDYLNLGGRASLNRR